MLAKTLANTDLVETTSLKEEGGYPSLYVNLKVAFGKSKAEFSGLLRRPGERVGMLMLSITLVNPFGQA